MDDIPIKVVTLQEKGKDQKQLEFITWKDDRKAFYARSGQGKPTVVTLHPPVPKDWDFKKRPPFPECAPVQIMPCQLVHPPCCRSAKDFWVDPDPWEEISLYVDDSRKLLCLTPEDDAPFLAFIKDHKKMWRNDYEQKKKNLIELSLGELRLASEEERQQKLEILESRYNGPLRRMYGTEVAGRLNLTLEMVKDGVTGIRDAYLGQKWVKREGIDLG